MNSHKIYLFIYVQFIFIHNRILPLASLSKVIILLQIEVNFMDIHAFFCMKSHATTIEKKLGFEL